MEKKVSKESRFESKKYFLNEFELFDGEEFITFNIYDIDFDKKEITVAITNRGKITLATYELLRNKDGKLYFEYGNTFEKVNLDDFMEVEE